MRNAEELSITMAPAAANFAANARDEVAPAENRAMSSPVGSAVSASSTTMSVPFHGRVVPAERADAKYRISADREVALVEQAAHDAADLTRCSDDTDAKCSRHSGNDNGAVGSGPRRVSHPLDGSVVALAHSWDASSSPTGAVEGRWPDE